ncbi:MAG: UDP-N-acetylmuramoyl-L-alanyl-D-glutamate--2,6-diaminopimelate ligase [Spirochaetes bacterium]|nr:UDP-N-acetylmuramoyl-L-alanyl-D-glutamate--2,6-diaminopimelate ligase [Spirochaetota bacterium]
MMLNNGIQIKALLADLVNDSGGATELVSGEGSQITSVEYDSRKVRKGSLFIAVEGLTSDGHRFIGTAIEAGASAVCVARSRAGEFAHLKERGVGLLVSDDSRAALSRLSAAFFGFPSRSMLMVGITGTNGKTSITYMLESIMKRHGFNPGVIGTINYRWGGKFYPAVNTTPESRDLQEILWKMRRDGVDMAIMEISSHALELRRAEDIDLDAAVFTNLTRDHLDFHHDFESYFNAKKKIFGLLEASFKKGRCAVVNADDPYGREIILMRNHYSFPMKTFAIDSDADYMPDPASIDNSIHGLRYTLQRPDPGLAVQLKLLGTFQLYNSLAALAVSHQMGIDYEAIISGLSDLETVPGRFDVLKTGKGFVVIVDYAHTVDALHKLLRSVNELGHRKIITVFGCGGDRDRSKRPLMGKVAEENSDLAIVTSDNPRTEEPARIIQDIVSGLEGSNHEVIPERTEAIARAVSLAGEGDIVVIAGKGHEDYQIIGTEKIHFDDKEVAASCL